jgi:hypothetical protein
VCTSERDPTAARTPELARGALVHGLRPIPPRKVIGVWAPDEPAFERLARLRDRHVLEAAGFRLTDVPAPRPVAPPRFERQPADAPPQPAG